MRRIGMVVLSLILLSGVFGASITVAQDATPADGDEHPFVGAWMVDTEPQNPTNAPHMAIVSSDGTYFEVDIYGASLGAWEATGDRTASMTFHFLLEPEPVGVGTIRADVEVSENGQSWSGMYTLELVNSDGTSPGEVGPGQIEGTRIAVDPRGTAVGTFEEVYGADPETTPES